MTETREATGTCIMGASTERPCRYPATEALRQWRDSAPKLCAFHAATEPLVGEAEDMAICLDLVRKYLKGARKHSAAAPLVEALERLETDYAVRLERASGVLDDLKAAEFKLMRA